MDWKEYEAEITRVFTRQYPDAKITHDTTLPGRFSKTERQIDLLIEGKPADFEFRVVVDAKHHAEKLDVKDVEQFIAMLQDVGVDVGVMIAPHGYSQAALNRAHHNTSRVELDVLNFADLKYYQGDGAIPYSDSAGVILEAPLGWVVDARQGSPWPAALYQRGVDFEKAVKIPEWMYVKFTIKRDDLSSLDVLLHNQEDYIKRDFPKGEINYLDGVRRPDSARTTIRFCSDPSGFREHTGFVEFERFIFYCVLYSPIELEERNRRKLRFILRTVQPIEVIQAPDVALNNRKQELPVGRYRRLDKKPEK